jgi:hypothetical protein
MKKTPNLIFSGYDLDGIIESLFNPKIQNVLFENVFNNIKSSYKTNKKEVVICDVTQLEISISIPRNNWINALQTMLEHYIIIEDYSMCTQINKLIKDIKNG